MSRWMLTTMKAQFALAVAISITIGGAALGSSQKIEFEGVITSVTGPGADAGRAFVSPDGLLQGSYRFHPDSLTLWEPDVYTYSHSDLTFRLDGYNGFAPHAWSSYAHDTMKFGSSLTGLPEQSRDAFRWIAVQEAGLAMYGLGDYYVVDFVWLFEDFGKTAVPGFNATGPFLVDPPDLSDYDPTAFFVSFCAGNCPMDGIEVMGTITSLTVVPVPPAILLVATGAGLVGWWRRGRRAQ